MEPETKKQPSINNKELIEQGAEAKIYRILWKQQKTAILKERVAKAYRHPELDRKLAKERIQLESRNMQTAAKCGIRVPEVYYVNYGEKYIVMEHIDGLKMRDWFNQNIKKEALVHEQLANIGRIIQRLHDYQIIHGDLTTSNMIMCGDSITLIDFGLSYIKNSAEDKAVDLYVLERAFISTHPELETAFSKFFQGYTSKEVITRLEKVRQRGRKKIVFG